MARLRACLAALVGVLVVTGCTADPSTPDGSTSSAPGQSQVSTGLPDAATTVVDGAGPAGLAIATSQALYRSAPMVVLIGQSTGGPATVVAGASANGATSDLERAISTAVELGVPLLLTPAEPAATATPSATSPATPPASVAATPTPAGDAGPGAELKAELARLATRTVIPMDAAAGRWASGAGLTAVAADGNTLAGGSRPAPLSALLVLAVGGTADAAARATAAAAGARVLVLGGTDPRATSESVSAIAAAPTAHVLALGAGFGPADRLRHRIATAATGVQLPGGGQVVFPGRRMIALYGHPGDTVLGALGEQPLDAAIARAKQVAASYSGLVGEPVVPAFEIIATVASSGAGSDGNYSNEVSVEKLRPWVEAAKAAGVYVVLDLQPGRTDFLSQAKLYQELLRQPNVGLALDPEWRLRPDQVHMVQIGSVSAEEINQTGQWLQALTHDLNLPQKVFLLHQFRLDMITNRSALVTDYDDLRVVIHVDGFGSPGAKLNTWNTLNDGAPANIYWGWKNFYDEDKPTFSPQQTMAVTPAPVFVSYQ